MHKITRAVFLLLFTAQAILLSHSCNNKLNPDSIKSTNEKNDTAFADPRAKASAEFLVRAVDGNMLKVELGRLPVIKSREKELMAFGNQFAEQHAEVLAGIKTFAESKNITLPANLGYENQHKLSRLSKLYANEFDQEFVKTVIIDLEGDIREYEAAAGSEMIGTDTRAWAAQALPLLKQHLETINGIDKRLNIIKEN